MRQKNICYVINDQGQFKFLGKEIGVYGVYHYISETFYLLLKERNSKLNKLYNTWYLISTSNLEKNHFIAKNIKALDCIDMRLFFP